MPAIDEMMHFCYQENICKFSFCSFKSSLPGYIRGYRQLFYTFDKIMQQTFNKIKCKTMIFTNIEI